MQYALVGNFGNNSLAALQFLIEQEISNLHFITIDTGWASHDWLVRIEQGIQYAKHHQVTVHQLKSKVSFPGMTLDRKQFPSQKFQWCANFLKGLTLLNYLDELDPLCETTLIFGKRRLDTIRLNRLSEFIDDSEHHNGRRLWHPLWNASNEEFKGLIKRAGFDFLPHSSRECYPCIHSTEKQLIQLDKSSKSKVNEIEQHLRQTMFEKPIYHYQSNSLPTSEKTPTGINQFDLGCGSLWGCGE